MKKDKIMIVGLICSLLILCGCVEQGYVGTIKNVTAIHGPERDAYGYYNWSIVIEFEEGKNITLDYLDDHYYKLKEYIGKKVEIRYDYNLESIKEID